MRPRISPILPTMLLIAATLGFTFPVCGQQPQLKLRIDDMMTPKELSDSGVATLTPSQREALNGWLNRYTETVIKFVASDGKAPNPTAAVATGSDCVPAVESTIAGDFNGWEGDTIFKLDNGQIWEQAEYDYNYSYSFRPDVTIYETSSGCAMKVEDEDETIRVRRIK
jgi:hypothetical protein